MPDRHLQDLRVERLQGLFQKVQEEAVHRLVPGSPREALQPQTQGAAGGKEEVHLRLGPRALFPLAQDQHPAASRGALGGDGQGGEGAPAQGLEGGNPLAFLGVVGGEEGAPRLVDPPGEAHPKGQALLQHPEEACLPHAVGGQGLHPRAPDFPEGPRLQA